jgi:23S rRNA pseudouridine1911/1915/1917 synthase
MNIPILYENNSILIINKPSGLVVHSDGKTEEPTLVDWILDNYPMIRGVGEDMYTTHQNQEIHIPRPGIVHRLDRDTSGCMVIAKTNESYRYLKEKFKQREVKKTYQALVYGFVKHDKGVIDAPIGKSRKDFRMRSAGPHARGTKREACTHYRVIARYEDHLRTDKQNQTLKYTLLKLQPETGRTHQIRVHLKYINYPIVSDSLYAGKRKPALGLSRTALHASSLEFKDMTGEMISISCPLADDIVQACEQLTVY